MQVLLKQQFGPVYVLSDVQQAKKKQAEVGGELFVPITSVEEVIADQAEWSTRIFGSERGPLGALRHLQEEVKEAIDNPRDILEFADIQLLLWDAMRRAGFSWPELIQAASVKMQINRGRDWRVDHSQPEQPTFHIRTPPELGAIHANGGHPEHVPALATGRE